MICVGCGVEPGVACTVVADADVGVGQSGADKPQSIAFPEVEMRARIHRL